MCLYMLINVPTDCAHALLPMMKDFVRNGARKRTPPRRFAGVVIRSAPKKPTPDKACPFREPMKDKRDRIIAALTVEAAMLELHAEQLSASESAVKGDRYDR